MSADTITPAVAVGAVLRARSRRTALVFVLAAALLAAVAVASILVGVRGIDPAAVWQALGSNHHTTTALAVLLGPVMLLGADVIGRLVVPNAELEAGVVCAFIGAPVLIAVARGRKVAAL